MSKFTEIELQQFIEDIEKPFDVEDGLMDVIDHREKHFFHHRSCAPQLTGPFKSTYQTDIPRQKHGQLKARLTENPFVVHAFAYPDTQKNRDNANDAESVFNTGLDIVQRRQGLNIQGALSDGQIIDCYGVLHWRKADHLWPTMPQNEWMEGEPPEDEPAEDYEIGPLSLGDQAEQSYRMSPKGQLKKRQADTARAGFPWFVDVLHPSTFLFREDKSVANGFAACIIRREVGLLDYVRRANNQTSAGNGEMALSVYDVDKQPIYGERDAPAEWAPSADEWGERVRLYSVWTRVWFYEAISGLENKGMFHIVKDGAHPYEMPPFALAPAQEINVIAPEYRYLPALAGVFEVKPHYDRHMAVQMVLAEQNALPLYYLMSTGTGDPLLAEDGTMLVMSRDSAFSQKVPDGYKLETLGPEMLNPAFLSLAEWWKGEMDDAAPATGQAEFTSTAQPWTVRLQQTQANVEPGLLLANQAKAIETMVQNMALVMSKSAEDGGFGEGVTTYARTKDGKIDRSKTISVDPKQITSVDFGVDINKVSGAEQVSKEQHGLELRAAAVLTSDDFYENYMGLPDATEYQIKLKAEQLAEQFVLPGLGQMAQQRWGAYIGLGPNGSFVNGMGQPVSPAQVLQQNGQQPTQMAMPNNGATQPQMPALSGLATPGTMPLGGMG